jgi:hypothetical protein
MAWILLDIVMECELGDKLGQTFDFLIGEYQAFMD